MNVIVKDCMRGCKTLSQLHDALVKIMTKGNTFLWHGEPDEDAKIDAARKKAEQQALEWIRESLDAIPTKIKRDMEALGR